MDARTPELPVDASALRGLYFDSLGGAGAPMAPAMELALRANFGSLARWREEFVAMGKAPGGGSGWVLLVFQPREGTLVNLGSADHTHAVAGGVPILALDMHAHSRHMGFGDAAGQHVDAFVENIHWEHVYMRYQQAVEHASDAFGAGQEEAEAAVLIDVRRSAIFEQSEAVIPGAQWRDPGDVGAWAAKLPRDRDVVVYCVYGHEVGRATAMRLRAAGINARYLRGGIDAWKAAGKPLRSKEGAP
jgi:Fe-Mn family superoxide dismutase